MTQTTHAITAEATAVLDCDTTSEPSHSQSEIIAYANPSDLCQGPWVLYKCEESDWYMSTFRTYFEEWQPLSFLKSQKPLPGRSPLRQVHYADDLGDDAASPAVEAVVMETRSTTLTEPRALQPQPPQKEDVFGPCGHAITVGSVSSEEAAIGRLVGCGAHRRDGLLADCRLAAAEELRAGGGFVAGGDARARSVTDWAKTGWPAAWGAEVRLTEADGKSWFLDTGETAVPCEYRGERRSLFGLWDDDDDGA